jgi:DNA primase
MEFHEAVEELAHLAGMEIPKSAIVPKEVVDKTERIYSALDKAREIYAQELQNQGGKAARDYLQNRGLHARDWAAFSLGYSPNNRTFLRDKLTGLGFSLEHLIDAGLVRKGDDGQTYDYFRNRVMFAIEDNKGRAISFGARTLDPDGMPKYLNGPESTVFSKGNNLYRYKNARGLIKNHPLIISEGYMDVIALEKAGLPAVAPLGTALTEEQMTLAWRMFNMPILCFDGDSAGQNAASRSLNRALPLINSFKSFRFAILPNGQDPDDILKNEGKAKLLEVLEESQTLTQFLFNNEAVIIGTDTAEARASLRKSLRARANEIKDDDLKNEVNLELKRLLDKALGRNQPESNNQNYNNNRKFSGGRNKKPASYEATQELKQNVKLSSQSNAARTVNAKRKRSLTDLLMAVILCPQLLEYGIETLAELDFGDSALDSLRNAILDINNHGETLDFQTVHHHLQSLNNKPAILLLEGIKKIPINPYVKKGMDFETIKATWHTALLREEEFKAIVTETKRSELERFIEEGEEEGYHKFSMLINERQKLSKDGNQT